MPGSPATNTMLPNTIPPPRTLFNSASGVTILFSSAKRMTYNMIGGTPNLDKNYTVFGEVETGMEVVDEIALQQVDDNNRPIKDISMKMEVMKEEIK